MGVPLTVCVAAIADSCMVIAASDRMLTAADMEFQPPQSKILQLTPSICVMAAGDSVLHTEIMNGVSRDARAKTESEPETWRVRDAVDLYHYYYDAERVRQAEAAYLTPLGLTTDSFIARQDEMNAEFLKLVGRNLVEFEMSELSVIICGVDQDGAHIYIVNNGDILCHDEVGFAAIGAGERHAASQFMLAGHTRYSHLAGTVLLAYIAKRRAEVAPGVGSATDMISIGPTLGFSAPLSLRLMAKLELEFRAIEEAERRAAKEAATRMFVYIHDLLEEAAEQINPDPSTEP